MSVSVGGISNPVRPETASGGATTVNVDKTFVSDGKLVVPLTLTIDVNDLEGLNPMVKSLGLLPLITSGDKLTQAVVAANKEFGKLPGVLRVRDGVEIQNNEFGRPAIIVVMDATAPDASKTRRELPSQFADFPLQARNVSAMDFLHQTRFVTEAVPPIRYLKPDRSRLTEVNEKMRAIFSVSPDAGWPQLKDFLGQIKKSLTLGLYNFSTNHVKEHLLDVLDKERASFKLVLGRSGIDKYNIERFEEKFLKDTGLRLGDRFNYQTAESEGRRLFAGHYHIKLAVRDSEAVWMSSGNWDHSNQPDVDPIASVETSDRLLKDKNREWHAIFLNAKLAKIFEFYIDHDFEQYKRMVESSQDDVEQQMLLVPIRRAGIEEEAPLIAQYFPPLVVNKILRIQPLLSPDNFLERTQELIESASESILIQNQNFSWRDNSDPRFAKFAQSILDKSRDGVDVQILLRGDYGTEHKESLIRNGFRAEQIRVVAKCHTKGLIIDGKTVLLGSHNWTDHGALGNRDASVIVYDQEVAEYYKQIFEFDWQRSTDRVQESAPGIRSFRLGDEIPDGFQVVSASDL
jgi:hypothetical protein